MRVGVIGLGNIGGAIAANLVEDGHEVAVFETDPARVEALAGGGAHAAAGGLAERDWSELVVWMEREADCRLELAPREKS